MHIQTLKQREKDKKPKQTKKNLNKILQKCVFNCLKEEFWELYTFLYNISREGRKSFFFLFKCLTEYMR